MKRKNKNFNSIEKSKIVLALLKEDSTLAQLVAKYQITGKTIQNWKKQFLSNASCAFETNESIDQYKEQIQTLKHQNDEFAKKLGKTTIERDWAVEKLKGLDLFDKKCLLQSKPYKLSKQGQCRLVKLNRSSAYYNPRGMNQDNKKILQKIHDIYIDHPDYGYRYIHQKLLEDNVMIGKDRVLKYMRIMNIQAIYPKPKKCTSTPNKQHKIYNYLLDPYWSKTKQGKAIHIPHPNQVWSGDITYIKTKHGFIYCAVIIDWHTKAVLSHKVSNTMDTSLVTDVLNDALSKYPAPQIFNSDQGSQYTSEEHIAMLKKYNIQISMNGKGRSIDNIAVERFFRTLKYNNIFINDFASIKELKTGINNYIANYNYHRFHSSIGYQKPMDMYLSYIKNVA